MTRSTRKKFFIGGTLGLVALVGVSVYALSHPEHELTTTLDLASGTVRGDDEGPLAEKLDDLSTILSNTAGALLAAVDSNYIHIREGLRKEEIATIYGKNLDWSDEEKLAFAEGPEGHYYPGTYPVSEFKDETIMRELMQNRFKREVEGRYSSSTESVVKLDTILKVASLIEREAGGKSDMRLISGIIWNRIFRGMTLDIDATLQYAKGDEENGWWPAVDPADKKIASPYNTYKNKGLPPTPIANPGLASIDAALRPKKTDCLFYLHDKHRTIHCSATYEGHKKNIAKYYP